MISEQAKALVHIRMEQARVTLEESRVLLVRDMRVAQSIGHTMQCSMPSMRWLSFANFPAQSIPA